MTDDKRKRECYVIMGGKKETAIIFSPSKIGDVILVGSLASGETLMFIVAPDGYIGR